MLYMLRTILVHLQEQLLQAVHRIWYMPVYAGTCGYSHTTATRMVPAYTKRDVQLIKVAPDDRLIQSETCRASMKK